jgi:hypothetical protein
MKVKEILDKKNIKKIFGEIIFEMINLMIN